jgi:hypothetical protein
MVGEWEVGANVKPAKSISEETSRGFSFFIFMYVLFSTVLHLLPLRFHCVGGSWDRILALAVRFSNHTARSHPFV